MAYLGRYPLGAWLPLAVRAHDASGTPTLPGDVPHANVYSAAGSVVATKKLPILDRYRTTALFVLPLQLGSGFSAGTYYVSYHYTVSAYIGLEADTFEVVAGGSTDGAVIAQHWYPNPHARFLVQQLDSGKLVYGRNPDTEKTLAAASGNTLESGRYRE